MTAPIFEEKQQMIKTKIGILVVLLSIISVSVLVRQLLVTSQNTTGPLAIYAIVLIIVLGLLWLFLTATLTTRLTQEGITIHYPPFIKRKHFAWSDISKVYTRQYKPIREFGGWGFRNNGKCLAYNVSGNFGLQLEFTAGKNILVGSQKQAELTAFIQYLKDTKTLTSK